MAHIPVDFSSDRSEQISFYLVADDGTVAAAIAATATIIAITATDFIHFLRIIYSL